jgi:hypothetical protein
MNDRIITKGDSENSAPGSEAYLERILWEAFLQEFEEFKNLVPHFAPAELAHDQPEITKVARTLPQLQVVLAIIHVWYENHSGPFEGMVSRQDIFRRVDISGSGLNTILEKYVKLQLLCPYRDQAFYSITEKSLRVLEDVIKKWSNRAP